MVNNPAPAPAPAGFEKKQIRYNPSRLPNHCWSQKTRVFLLRHSENPVIISSFVWIGYQRVTDRQTDGPTDGTVVVITVLCIASNAATL